MRNLLLVAVSIVVLSLATPAAALVGGQYDCRQCTEICWEGLFIVDSCEYFCVQFSPTMGSEECHAGETYCYEREPCFFLVA